MGKKPISYLGLVKVVLNKEKAESKKSGKKFDNKKAFSNAAQRWKGVKAGTDHEYIVGKGKTRTKTKTKSNTKSNTKSKTKRKPLTKHKRKSKSKSRSKSRRKK